MIFAGCRSTLVFHSWPFTQISFGFITLCQSLSCDILCLDQPSLSSKWPWTKSNSLLLPRVRFDIHALSLNIQISRSCSNRLCLNLPREFRYCNGSEFEFPSWINKPLFGSKAIVSRYPFMDIWDTKQRALSLNLTSFSWYGRNEKISHALRWIGISCSDSKKEGKNFYRRIFFCGYPHLR